MTADDLKIMIRADLESLAKALVHGDRVEAHGFVDSIIDNKRTLEDLENGPAEIPSC